MTMNYLRKPSNLFWVISSIALVWNLMGVLNYLDQAFMTDKILETLPKEQQILYQDVPAWVTTAFAIAVFSESFGPMGIAMPIMIIAFGGYLIWYSRKANEHRWLY